MIHYWRAGSVIDLSISQNVMALALTASEIALIDIQSRLQIEKLEESSTLTSCSFNAGGEVLLTCLANPWVFLTIDAAKPLGDSSLELERKTDSENVWCLF